MVRVSQSKPRERDRDGTGDAVLSTSVIPVLKSAFPEVEIGFLIGS